MRFQVVGDSVTLLRRCVLSIQDFARVREAGGRRHRWLHHARCLVLGAVALTAVRYGLASIEVPMNDRANAPRIGLDLKLKLLFLDAFDDRRVPLPAVPAVPAAPRQRDNNRLDDDEEVVA